MLRSHVGRLPLLGAAIGVAMLIAACASSAAGPAPVGQPLPPQEAAPTAAPTAAPSAASVADTSGGGTGGADGGPTADLPTGPLIIRTGSLNLEVKDLDGALLQSRGRIIGLGGYVSDSQQSNSGDSSTALITYRIPAARWDEAMDALKGYASKVLGENTKAVDVTGQVIDIGARIDNLKATERALQTIMDKATKISDILDVQNQLTSVRGQIEQLSTQQAHLNDQAAMGTLAVTYTLPVIAVTTQVTTGWNLGAEVDRAVAQLVQVGQGLAVVGVWLVVVGLPILLGIGLVVGLGALLVRRFGPRRQPASPAA
jgi:hypothetical protein